MTPKPSSRAPRDPRVSSPGSVGPFRALWMTRCRSAGRMTPRPSSRAQRGIPDSIATLACRVRDRSGPSGPLDDEVRGGLSPTLTSSLPPVLRPLLLARSRLVERRGVVEAAVDHRPRDVFRQADVLQRVPVAGGDVRELSRPVPPHFPAHTQAPCPVHTLPPD